MKVYRSGIDYNIMDGGTDVFDYLPPKVYDVKFNKMRGIWLSERDDLDSADFKVYGNVTKRVEKVMTTFELRKRNLGVLLSGEKGMGKSVFMRLTAVSAMKSGMPVIVVNSNFPGLSDFIRSIDQHVVVLLDEFEKNFTRDSDDEQGSQNQFLTLLDGDDSGKKLFLVAVNRKGLLSEFFLNRPGRFYYHFKFTNLGADDVRDYLEDNLNPDPDKNAVIDKIVTLSQFSDMSYDILSAICTEINNGYGLSETISDLNIDLSEEGKYYDYEILVGGKTKLVGNGWVDLTSHSESVRFWRPGKKSHSIIEVYFDGAMVKYDAKENGFVIPSSAIETGYFNESFGEYDIDKYKFEDLPLGDIVLRPATFNSIDISNLV